MPANLLRRSRDNLLFSVHMIFNRQKTRRKERIYNTVWYLYMYSAHTKKRINWRLVQILRENDVDRSSSPKKKKKTEKI